MKILVLSINFPNATAPAQGVFVKERLRYLARYCDIKVVSPIPWFPFLGFFKRHAMPAAPGFEVIDGLAVWHPRFFYIPGLFKSLDGLFLFLSVLPMVRKIAKTFHFDLIDAHFAYPDGFAGVLLGKYFQVPVSVTLRGTIVTLSRFYVRRALIRWTLQQASFVFAVAKFLKSVAVSIGAPESAIRVVPNGVDFGLFYPMDRRKARSALGLSQASEILISVGSLIPHKGYHHVIAVLPDLLSSYPDLVFVIVGGASVAGDYSDALRRQVTRLGLEKHVLLAGPKRHHELRTWLAAANVFCLATKCEGWANVFLEAMACGLPVVSTAVGGNPEIITSEAVGMLVPHGDSQALKQAIGRALERAWDREAIVAHARQYSWEDVAARVFSVLQGKGERS